MIRQYSLHLFLALLMGGVSSIQAQDSYEPDNGPTRASPFQVGSNQVHTFHSPTDEDWVRFLVPPGGVFDIEAEQLGANIDLQVEVYYESFNGTRSNVTFLAADEEGKGIGEVESTGIDLVSVRDLPFGFYLVRVFSADTNCFGAGAEYNLSIFEPTGATLLAIIALDTQDGAGGPPVDTVAIIDGAASYPFGAGNTVSIPDLSPGTHTVEVRTAPGYVMVADPDAPEQDKNPYNPIFSNPRFVTIADGSVSISIVPFAFDPVVRVEGRVLDAHTGEGVGGVSLSFEGTEAPMIGVVVTQQFNDAWYDTVWRTEPDGSFPRNVFLKKAQYTLRLDAPNHVSDHATNTVAALTPGTTNRQGIILLPPLDVDTNGMADVWEQLHLGGGAAPDSDNDGDGAANRHEYLAGTDPTNRQSVFGFDPLVIPGTNAICIAWPVVKDRFYSLESAPTMSDTNSTWLIDRWRAPSNGVHRLYDQTSLAASSRVYRVRINLP